MVPFVVCWLLLKLFFLAVTIIFISFFGLSVATFEFSLSESQGLQNMFFFNRENHSDSGPLSSVVFSMRARIL